MARWNELSYGARIALITVAGFILRGAFLSRQPLWRDEAFTALAVQHPASQMLSIVGHDSAPPLAYIIDRFIASYISASPAALRFVPFLAGTCAIPIGAALGRRAAGDRGGIGAAFVCALIPTLVISSRDVRMYQLSATFVMAATLAVWRYVEKPSWQRWLICTLLAALALQTEYFAAPALAGLLAGAAVGLHARRRDLLAMAAGGVAAAATLIPWFDIWARPQFDHTSGGFWVEPLGLKTIFGTLVQFFSGPPVDPGTPGKLLLQGFQGLAIAAGIVALAVLVRRPREPAATARPGVRYLAIAGGGGTLLLAVVSLWHPILDARYASVGWGPLLALTGVGLTEIPWRRWRAAAAIGIVAASLVLSAAVTHPDSPAAVTFIDSHLANGFVDAAPSEYLLVEYYGDARVRSATHVVATDLPWFWGTAVYPSGAVVPSVPQSLTATGEPLLVVDEADSPPASPPGGYRESAQQCFTGMCVTVLTPG